MVSVISTASNRDGELLRVYSREKLIKPLERTLVPFLDGVKEATDEEFAGSRREFPILARMSHGVGNPGDAGDASQTKPSTTLKGVVTKANWDGVFQISEDLLKQGEGDGSFHGDVLHQEIMRTSINLFTYQQILLACGHGTGRLGTVEANTVAATTFVAALPESYHQLRVGYVLEFYNLDSGGALQATQEVLAIDENTRTITLDGAVSLTAGWGFYLRGAYTSGVLPNGMRNIIDDGDFASTIFSLTRSDNPTVLNAKQIDPGALQDYSEAKIRQGLNRAKMTAGKMPTELWTNHGVIGKHFDVTVPDRVYQVTGTETPSLIGGFNHERLKFQHGSMQLPFKICEDLPAREIYGLYKPGLRRSTLKPIDWIKDSGGKVLHLMPAATASNGFRYAWQGMLHGSMNIFHKELNANVKWSNLRDAELAGDA
jgi:hypothetical protein